MPCRVDPPSDTELETKRLNDFLDEIGEPTPKTQSWFLGKSRKLTTDQMTAKMCMWCSTHDVSQYSLELQIWWRDHQRWDAQRQAAEQAADERQRLAAGALKKLTPRERQALGLKDDPDAA